VTSNYSVVQSERFRLGYDGSAVLVRTDQSDIPRSAAVAAFCHRLLSARPIRAFAAWWR